MENMNNLHILFIYCAWKKSSCVGSDSRETFAEAEHAHHVTSTSIAFALSLLVELT